MAAARDNPTVREALVDNRAKEMREAQTQSHSLKAISDKLSDLTKVDRTAKDVFDDILEEQRKTNTDNKAIDHLGEDIVGSIVLSRPKKKDVITSNNSNTTIIDVLPTMAREDTLIEVRNFMGNLAGQFPALEKGISFVQDAIDSLTTFLQNTPVDLLRDIDKGISNLVEFFTPTIFAPPPIVLTWYEKVVKALDLIAVESRTIAENGLKMYKTDKSLLMAVLGLGKANLASGTERASSGLSKMISFTAREFMPLFSFFGDLLKILSPFKSLLIGGAFSLVLMSLFEFVGSLTKTGEALSKLFTGGFEHIGENLTNVFKAFIGDMTGMYKGTAEAGSLMAVMKDLWNKQILPTFDYLVNGVLIPFFTEMNNIFNNEIAPRFKKMMDYLNGPDGAGIIEGIKSFGKFLTDVLIFLFGTVLPPILDAIGLLLYGVIETIKALWPEIKNVTEAVLDFGMNFINTLVDFIRGLFSGISDLWAAGDTKKTFGEQLSLLGSGLEKIVGSLIKFIFGWYDNIISFWTSFVGIDDMVGMHGAKASEMVAALFSYIGSKIEEFSKWVHDTITGAFDKTIQYIRDFDIIGKVKDKLSQFADAILSVIPSWEDIKSIIRSAAESLSIPSSVIDTLIGSDQPNQQPMPISAAQNIAPKTGARAQYLQRVEENSTRGRGDSAPVNVNNISVAQSPARAASRPQGGQLWGGAVTTQPTTPIDRYLYGTR